jgi:hypothetical protein
MGPVEDDALEALDQRLEGVEAHVAQLDEALHGLELDPQPRRVAQGAVGVGETAVEVGVGAVRMGCDHLTRPGEDVELDDGLVGQAVAERGRLDAEARDGAAEGDGLQLGDDQRRQAVREGGRDEVLVGAHAPHIGGPGLRVHQDDAVETADVEARGARAVARPEQVRGPLGQAHAGITRDGVVARHETLHCRAVHRPGIASLRDEDPRC